MRHLPLVVAQVRYWLTVAPRARSEIRCWNAALDEVGDPRVRLRARSKLRREHGNIVTTAALATLAPRRHRRRVVAAIVALQTLYDYLDAVGEEHAAVPVQDARALLGPLISALTGDATGVAGDGDEPLAEAQFLDALASGFRRELGSLPGAGRVERVMAEVLARTAEGQVRAHATPHVGSGQLASWAARDAAFGDLVWFEHAAGAAASILSVHALIVSAADPGVTRESAAQLDRTFLALATLTTMLDSLIDREEDLAEGNHSFVGYYADDRAMAEGLAKVARRAAAAARTLPDGAHHHMTVAGIAAFYLSSPKARTAANRPIADAVIAELRPVITPILAIFRVWRLAKRCRDRVGRRTHGRRRWRPGTRRGGVR